MKYIVTLIWAALIGCMIGYVLSSMGGVDFSVIQSLVYAAVAYIVILLMELVLKPRPEQ